ncbi:hypothetical protein [Streptomyces sp. NPDC041003]|uniref:hypothetical protein n=1 Tax=Streptomyces sp. NPDC041003 TaxID=3155730 RepID=UPI0034030717
MPWLIAQRAIGSLVMACSKAASSSGADAARRRRSASSPLSTHVRSCPALL